MRTSVAQSVAVFLNCKCSVGDGYLESGGSSGSISLATGNAGRGNSGDISLMTGGSEEGNTGSINITVRRSNSGNGGNIAVRAGLWSVSG